MSDGHIPICTKYADGLYASKISARAAKSSDRLTEKGGLTEVDVRDYMLHTAIQRSNGLLGHGLLDPPSNKPHKLHSGRRMFNTDSIKQCSRDPNELGVSNGVYGIGSRDGSDDLTISCDGAS